MDAYHPVEESIDMIVSSTSNIHMQDTIQKGSKGRSIFHRIPVEVIAHVFEHYVHDSHNPNRPGRLSKAPFALGAVSQTWRHIAWSIPRLWTTFVFDFKLQATNNHVQLAIDWLGRSGCLPVTIRMYMFELKPSPVALSRLLALTTPIGQVIHRCRILHLAIPSSILPFFSMIPHSPPVHMFSLKPRPFQLHIRFETALSDLSFDNINMGSPNVNVDWSNLTYFGATHLSVDEVLGVLQLAPRMTEYDLEYVYDVDGVGNFTAMFSGSIHHPHLQKLEIEFDCEDLSSTIFFQKSTFPNLTSLFLDTANLDFPASALADFLERSSCQLKDLILFHSTVRGGELIRIARAVPSLTKLCLYTSLKQLPQLDEFYTTLCMDSTQRDILSTEEPLLPWLRSLTINTGPVFPWKMLPRFFYTFSGEDNDGRRPLEEVKIDCTDLEPGDDSTDIVAVGPTPSLIDNWDTFFELDELRGFADLNLRVECKGNTMGDLFELSLEKLTADDIANGRTPPRYDGEFF